MYIARMAALSHHGSMQRILEEFFPNNWEEQAERLAEKTRKLGYKDHEFYPWKLIKKMGIKTKLTPGRRRSKAIS